MLLSWRRFRAVPLALFAALAMVQPALAQKPAAVVSVKSFDALVSDFKYLMTLAGQGEMANQIDGIINAATQGKGLAGLDTKRPFGVLVNLPKNLGAHEPPPAVAFFPITKQEELLDFLSGVSFPAEKADGGLFKVTVPTGDSIYLRFAHRHVFATNKQELLKGDLPDPATVLTAVHKDNLFAASLNLGAIPKELKQFGMQMLDQVMEQGRREAAGKPPAEREVLEAAMKLGRGLAERVVEDSEEISLSANVNQKEGRLQADFAWKARAGSPLAKGFQTFGAGRSAFSGLAQDAAASLLVRVPVLEEVRATYRKLFDLGLKEIQKAPDAKQRELAERLLRAVEPNLTLAAVDYGLALRGPASNGTYVVVYGAHIKGGKKLEETLLALFKEVVPPREREKIRLEQVAHGGTNIHVISVPGAPVDPQAKAIFGELRGYIAFREDAVFASFGERGLDAIKQAIDQSGKTSAVSAATAPVQLEGSIARLAPLSPEKRDQVNAAVQKVFSGGDKDKDRIRVSVQGGDALRVRLEVSAAVVKLAGELGPQLGR